MRRYSPLLLLLPFALAAGLAVLRASVDGMGFTPDSVSYFVMAEGVAAGKGFVDVRRYDTPVKAIYPPGYAILLAAPTVVGFDLMASIRWLHAVLFAFSCVVVGWIALRYSGSAWLMLTASGLFLLSGNMIFIHARVWSEVPFIAAVLLFIAAMAAYLEKPRTNVLCAAALFAACSVMFRYPGIASLAAGGLLLLAGVVKDAPGRARRLRDLAIFAAFSSFFFLLWLARNLIVTGHPYIVSNRGPSRFAFSKSNLERGLETIQGWTGQPPGLYVICLALLLAGLLCLTVRDPSSEDRGRPAWPLILAALGFIVPYAAVMVGATYSFSLPKPLDLRALGPIFGPLLWLILVGSHRWVASPLARLIARSGRRPPVFVGHGLCLAGFSILLYAGFQDGYAQSSPDRITGMLKRDLPEVVEAFKTIEPEGVVFSNLDDLVYMRTGKRSYRVPRLYHYDTRDIRVPDYDEKVQSLTDTLASGGMIVYYSKSKRTYLPSEEDLQRLLPLDVVLEASDGRIYRVRTGDMPRYLLNR